MEHYDELPCAPPSRRSALQVVVAAFPAVLTAPPATASSSLASIDEDADGALDALYGSSDNAQELAARARAVLVFAHIANAGFVLGGQEGNGVMRIGGSSAAYYRIVGAPAPGLSPAQAFSLAFFFVTPTALAYVGRGDWSIGAGPSVAVAGAGFAQILNTTTLTEDVYAVPFGQRGMMAGLGLEGSRIFRIHPA